MLALRIDGPRLSGPQSASMMDARLPFHSSNMGLSSHFLYFSFKKSIERQHLLLDPFNYRLEMEHCAKVNHVMVYLSYKMTPIA